MYLWNYWNVNVPPLPLIFKTKGYRCASCTHADTGPSENGKGALISLFVMLQRVPPPCVFFWISLVHPSPTSLPFSARNSRIHNGTARRSTEGRATINEWLFSIGCSHCGCCNWLHLCHHTTRCFIPVTGEGVQEKASPGKMNDFHDCGATTWRRVPEVDSVDLQIIPCLEKVSKNLFTVRSHILQPLMKCTHCALQTQPPQRTTTLWHKGSYAWLWVSPHQPFPLPPLPSVSF